MAMLLRHSLSHKLFLIREIKKNDQEMIRATTPSSTTFLRIGQLDVSIAVDTRSVAFQFTQLGLVDVEISIIGAVILFSSGRYEIPCSYPT